ncbi:MAG: tetratricopeptide repeat-containing sensor histidine kinase [Balneolaceae bacterium]
MIRFLLIIICILALAVPASNAQTSHADSLKTAINPAIQEPETVESILMLSEILIDHDERTEAFEWLKLSYEVSEHIEYEVGLFKSLTLFGSIYLDRSMPDSALVMLDQAENYASTPVETTELLNQRGKAYDMAGQLLLAIESYEKAISIADSMDNSAFIAELQINMGNLYSNLGDPTNALRSYYNGLEYAEMGNDSTLMAEANNNVGLKFYELENYEQAEYFLLRSESLSRDLNLNSNLRLVLLNLGNLYSNMENYEEAEFYYQEALDVARLSGDNFTEVRIFYNRGLMEARKENIEAARELFTYAYNRSIDMNTISGRYLAASGIGNLENSLGNTGQAIRWLARANQIIEGTTYSSFLLQSYLDLYDAYKNAGNSAESLKWLEIHRSLNDSLTSTEKNRLLAEYEIRFNLKRNEQETAIIRARQQEAQTRLAFQQRFLIVSLGGLLILSVIGGFLVSSNRKRSQINLELEERNNQLSDMNETVQQQNKELEEINHIKNKLFAIIAHDLRGPLSSLQSLLYLIREHDLSEDELDEVSKSLERNLQENASMMDNLLAWARSQMNGISTNRRVFKVEQAFKAVVDQIQFQAEKKGIAIEMDTDSGMEMDADYDMIKLVVRNLVSNAIKFSKPGGTIVIHAAEKEGYAEVRIIDDGIGIKEEDQGKIFGGDHFTSRGTDNEKGNGLGLTLCKEFIEGHGGNIRFESETGVGTTFIFTVPYPDVIPEEENSEKLVEGN